MPPHATVASPPPREAKQILGFLIIFTPRTNTTDTMSDTTTIYSILASMRLAAATERDKGARFEKLICRWLTADPVYAALFDKAWLWADFANETGIAAPDMGIDIVARHRDTGLFTAIQCKFYDEDTVIAKAAVDSFISASGKTYPSSLPGAESVSFAGRIWVATSERYGDNADEALRGQTPQVVVVNLGTLAQSPVDWQALADGKPLQERKPAEPRDYQANIVADALRHYETHDRGTLVMACGTGKTLTSLFLAQALCGNGGAAVLFLAPSIALVSQTLRSWFAAAREPLTAVCVCSDTRAADTTDPEQDDMEESLLDLPIPSTTCAQTVAETLRGAQGRRGLTVVFSTYQSIAAVHEAQRLANVEFALAVCDEAHRTAASYLAADKAKGRRESPFARIHDADYVRAKRRLYMTATPKIYAAGEKDHAKQKDDILFSMNDEAFFGPRIATLSFGQAVERGLLTDYKVLVLAVDESMVGNDLLERVKARAKEGGEEGEALQHVIPDMTARMLGAVAAMSKSVVDCMPTEKDPFDDDPDRDSPLTTAIAFCDYVTRTRKTKAGTYVTNETARALETIAREYRAAMEERGELTQHAEKYLARLADVRADYVTGAMPTNERERRLAILREPVRGEAHIVCNVGCLSEGVDVPALDAVIFLSPKKSPIALVQSVGRVMRRFEGKRYGYVIVPVIVPMGQDPNDVVKSTAFKPVWDILSALRSHDETLAAELSSHTYTHVRYVRLGSGADLSPQGRAARRRRGQAQDCQPSLFEAMPVETTELLYARMTEVVGDRMYWPTWSKKVGDVATRFVERISAMLAQGRHAAEMDGFVAQLRESVNPSIGRQEAVAFLAQHLVSRPVFDALFTDYDFIANNPVSRAMNHMVDLLEGEAFADDRRLLSNFAEQVRMVCKGLDTAAKRQEMIRTLYEQFFKAALPKAAEQLGIVYTPVECVDFIVRSVDSILRRDFGMTLGLATSGCRALDPFAGTGTFTARALQYLAGREDVTDDALRQAYRQGLLCNEIVPLSYYVADVNIETAFNGLDCQRATEQPYEQYDGICLADTFQLTESRGTLLFEGELGANARAAERELERPLTVVWGNPPYSVGQRSANDNAQNQSYPALEARIAATYAAKSDAGLKKGLYDSYIKAIRWASDRIGEQGDRGGVVAFISNGAWIDGNSQAGLRRCLAAEFDSVRVLNLRGNCRTSGELRRREGDNVFEIGSRTPIAITIMTRLPRERRTGECRILYHDIGDYLSREEKLDRLREWRSVDAVEWTEITPNAKGDWINQRDGSFDALTPLAPEKKYDLATRSLFVINSMGVVTSRDSWCYNFGKEILTANMKRSIDFYNGEVERYKEAKSQNQSIAVEDFINLDTTKFSWDRSQKERDLPKGVKYLFSEESVRDVAYRPFCHQWGYFNRQLNNCVYQIPSLYPPLYKITHREQNSTRVNLVICTNGIGDTNDFSCIITDCIPDLHVCGSSQCYPLYYYTEAAPPAQPSLFDEAGGRGRMERHSALSPWAVAQARERYGAGVTDEDVFFMVYAALHSPTWRARFADDLRKALPRLAWPGSRERFRSLAEAGRRLARLHLMDEADTALQAELEAELRRAGVTVEGDAEAAEAGPLARVADTPETRALYRVEKMRFERRGDRSAVIVNDRIAVRGIPAETYEYVVNGKSAVEWVMERMAVSQDKKSLIINDPNDWAAEHSDPRFILRHLLRVVAVSSLSAREIAGIDGKEE